MAAQYKMPLPYTVICKLCRMPCCSHMTVEVMAKTGVPYIDHGTLVRRNSDGAVFREAVLHFDGRIEWIDKIIDADDSFRRLKSEISN